METLKNLRQKGYEWLMEVAENPDKDPVLAKWMDQYYRDAKRREEKGKTRRVKNKVPRDVYEGLLEADPSTAAYFEPQD